MKQAESKQTVSVYLSESVLNEVDKVRELLELKVNIPISRSKIIHKLIVSKLSDLESKLESIETI